ncbi:hypothetical protein GQX74_010317 [Glossina fuscipes]|nr:hypothetical protein GQX74_010317 [Glossina fuscipes]
MELLAFPLFTIGAIFLRKYISNHQQQEENDFLTPSSVSLQSDDKHTLVFSYVMAASTISGSGVFTTAVTDVTSSTPASTSSTFICNVRRSCKYFIMRSYCDTVNGALFANIFNKVCIGSECRPSGSVLGIVPGLICVD